MWTSQCIVVDWRWQLRSCDHASTGKICQVGVVALRSGQLACASGKHLDSIRQCVYRVVPDLTCVYYRCPYRWEPTYLYIASPMICGLDMICSMIEITCSFPPLIRKCKAASLPRRGVDLFSTRPMQSPVLLSVVFLSRERIARILLTGYHSNSLLNVTLCTYWM